jgi:iron complex transport system substrate-binding protein
MVRAVLPIVLVALFHTLSGQAQAPLSRSTTRIVSLVPALTEMLFEIGVGPQVIGVSRFDRYPAQVLTLPRVGGLLDPDYEGILRLNPDLVITYGSQAELERRLAAGGIRVYSYRHSGLAGTLRTISELGDATGRAAEAEQAVARLQARLNAVRARVRGRKQPKTLLVFGREPGALRQVYASGGVGFESDLLEIAGGLNVFRDVPRESAQPSIELMLARAPEVIVELHGDPMPSDSLMSRERAVWSRLASVPAVRRGRVHLLYGDYLTIPGPRLGLVAETIARAVHPEAFR